jgi:cold shock CspA family protein
MVTGRIKWVNREQGFGFIETDTFSHVLFYHDCIENGCWLADFRESDSVLLEIKTTSKGPQAVRVKRFKTDSGPHPAHRMK